MHLWKHLKHSPSSLECTMSLLKLLTRISPSKRRLTPSHLLITTPEHLKTIMAATPAMRDAQGERLARLAGHLAPADQVCRALLTCTHCLLLM